MSRPDPRTAWHPRFADAGRTRALSGALGVPPLLAGLLVNRGVADPAAGKAFLEPSVDGLLDPFLMADMDVAADRIVCAVREREPVVVYGDVDVDGLTGTALLQHLFRFLELPTSVYVPNRAYEGYSFTEAGVAAIHAAGAKVVVSVDNGMSSRERVAELQGSGVDVIVTDHHLPTGDLPPAHAVLNPHRDDCGYPFKDLAGVGVAFKLACAVASRLHAGRQRSTAMAQFLGEALAWVALGTVADVMPLRGENRVLVSRGLLALPKCQHPGLRALLHVSELGDRVSAEDVGFRLAPRINAAGRMGREEVAVQLLTCDDTVRASELAQTITRLNKERQAVDRALFEELSPRVGQMPEDEAPVLSGSRWVPGVVGLVAGRLARAHHRPAALISFAGDGEVGKGSSRSIEGFDVHAVLEQASEHLEGFGGHAMAAGFTIRRTAVPAFREVFRRAWQRALDEGHSRPALEYEAETPLAALTPSLVGQIDRLEPFGKGNARPVLGTRGAVIVSASRMGDGSHLDLRVEQGGTRLRAVAFQRGDLVDELPPGLVVDLLHRPKMNRYGRPGVELELVDVRAASAGAGDPDGPDPAGSRPAPDRTEEAS